MLTEIFSGLKITGMLLALTSGAALTADLQVSAEVDPVSRHIKIRYTVPDSVSNTVVVACWYRSEGQVGWDRAAVRKYRSKTAEYAFHYGPSAKNSTRSETDTIRQEMETGQVEEYWAAGLTRTLVWEAYPQVGLDAPEDVEVKVTLSDTSGEELVAGIATVHIDFSDVVVLKDFSKILQGDQIVIGDTRNTPGWFWSDPADPALPGLLSATRSEAGLLLDPITLRPKLKGYYAIYVSVPYPAERIELRLSDELFNQCFNAYDGRECFWKIAKLDRKHVVISQAFNALSSSGRTGLEYIRMVPVTEADYNAYCRYDEYEHDKFTGGHTEVYSLAADDSYTRNSRWAETVAALKETRFDWVDVQVGRLGARAMVPSEYEEPLQGAMPRETGPNTPVVLAEGPAKMIMATDAWVGMRTFADAFDLRVAASFGAGNTYKYSSSWGTWAEAHPEFMDESLYFPLYKFPQVRQQLLSMYEEMLDAGAERLGLDFCRYPKVIEQPSEATMFLSELRALADRYTRDGKKVEILVRFPVPGVKIPFEFNVADWVNAGLVDIIVPSDVTGSVLNFDITPYVELVSNKNVKCLGYICLNGDAQLWPGGALERMKEYYDSGADGLFFYQYGCFVVGHRGYDNSQYRKMFSWVGSSQAVESMISSQKAENLFFSRGIYFVPSEYQGGRTRVWIEGCEPEIVELYKDGELLRRYEGTGAGAYQFGDDGVAGDFVVSGRPIVFEVRAKLGDQWIEKQITLNRLYISNN